MALETSEIYQDFKKRYECKEKYVRPKGKAYAENLGLDLEHTALQHGVIYVEQGHLPDALKKEFKKADNNGYHQMKVNSKIYKNWLAILKEIDPEYDAHSCKTPIREFTPFTWFYKCKAYVGDLDLRLLAFKCLVENKLDGLVEISEVEYEEFKLQCMKKRLNLQDVKE